MPVSTRHLCILPSLFPMTRVHGTNQNCSKAQRNASKLCHSGGAHHSLANITPILFCYRLTAPAFPWLSCESGCRALIVPKINQARSLVANGEGSRAILETLRVRFHVTSEAVWHRCGRSMHEMRGESTGYVISVDRCLASALRHVSRSSPSVGKPQTRRTSSSLCACSHGCPPSRDVAAPLILSSTFFYVV
jgi:hypothetical protein